MNERMETPLPLREQAALWDEVLAERFETVLPAAMQAGNLDMWLTITSENNEDPIGRSLLPAALLEPRGQMLLLFAKSGGRVRRYSISLPCGIEHLYENPWYRIGPNTDWKGHQMTAPANSAWDCLRDLVAQAKPKRIGINQSLAVSVANGLRASDRDRLVKTLGPEFAPCLTSAQDTLVAWMETRTPKEIEIYRTAVAIAHGIIEETFSGQYIKPGVTTNDDLRFHMMQRAANLGLMPTFDCSVAVFRHGLEGMHNETIVIEPGDVVHCDFGLRYMNLCTDAQELAYVRKVGESGSPEGLLHALRQTNQLQTIVREAMRPGVSGNEALLQARQTAAQQGIDATIYCHPIGYHPHAAGPSVGRFSNQQPAVAGEPRFRANSAHALELNARVAVPEWDGQTLMCCLESEIWIDQNETRYLYRQPTAFHII